MTHTLYNYQQEGAQKLADTTSFLLAWQMGTGKTPTSVVACDLAKAKRVLVLCPAVARPVWREAFTQWSKRPRPVRTFLSANASMGPAEEPTVLIVSYDLLSRETNGVAKRLASQKWDVLICDEAHALKNRHAVRTKAVYGKKIDKIGGIAGSARHVWLLTGTPVLNHANEFWTHLHALAPDTIYYSGTNPMPEQMFTERYCSLVPTPFGNKITGSRNQAELANRIESFVSRKRKEDVLKDLPPLTFGTLPVSIHDAKIDKDLLKAFNEAEAKAVELTAAFDTQDPEKFLDELRASQMALAAQRRITGLLKAPVVSAVVSSELADNDEKIIVFAHHADVIDKLMAELSKFQPVKIDGRTNAMKREEAVMLFQSDPACRVFIGQLQAASTAITLTAASNVLFAEADWTPAINAQAASRAHRIGQPSNVTARFVVLEGTMDAQIMRILARKTEDIAALVDADQRKEQAHV